MSVQIKKIHQGGIDYDSHPKHILPEDVSDALNIHNGVGEGGKYFIPQNIEGNRLVNFNLPAGTNKTIGWFEDLKENSVIYWVWNSSGSHSILRWYPSTNLVVPVLQETLLGFQSNRPVANRNLVDDLLSWTDGGIPREFNLKRAQRQDKNGVFKPVEMNVYFDLQNQFAAGNLYFITYVDLNLVTITTNFYISPAEDLETGIRNFVAAFNAHPALTGVFVAESCGTFVEVKAVSGGIYKVNFFVTNPDPLVAPKIKRVFTNIYPQTQDGYTFLETFINADKNPPQCEPSLIIKTDTAEKNNFIVSKIFQFRIQYFYVDGQGADLALSPISSVSIGVGNYIEVDFTDTRLNDENLTIIKGVGIYVKEGELGKWKFIKELGREEIGISNTIPPPVGTNIFRFFNDKEYSVISDSLAVKLFDAIPITSGAQEIFDNRKGYGDITEGYDRVCVETKLTTTFKEPPKLFTIKGIIVIRQLYSVIVPLPLINLDPVNNNSAIWNGNGEYFYGFEGQTIGQKMSLPGFVVYLAGTDFYAVSKQIKSQWSTNQDVNNTWNFTSDGINDFIAENNVSYDAGKSNDPFGFGNDSRDQNGAYIGDRFFANTSHGTHIYSTFEILGVPEGEYIIRIAGVETTAQQLNGTGYQKTSSYVMAVGNGATSVSSTVPQGFEYKIKVGATEISHDTVTAENANNIIYVGCTSIADLSVRFLEIISTSRAIISGYICDSDLTAAPIDYNGILQDTRIERALVSISRQQLTPAFKFNTIPPNWSQQAWENQFAVTDHNGFFYYAVFNLNSLPIGFTFKIDNVLESTFLVNVAQGFLEDDTPITLATTYGNGYKRIALRNDNSNIKLNGRTFIKGHILDGTTPQENVPVVAALGSWQRTDQFGEFKIPYYVDTFYNIVGTGGTIDRIGEVIFSSPNNFIVYNFTNDEIFIGIFPTGIQISAASIYNNTSESRWYILNDMQVDLLEEFLGISAWKRGHGEELGIIYYDRNNRQTTVNDHIRKVYVPFYTENQIKGLAQISWEIQSLPPVEATHYQWVRTHSVSPPLQFNATSITYVDSADNTTSFTNAVFIKIGFNSLLDYHTRYPNSDIGYTFERGDRMKLISNGAGGLFPVYLDAEIVKDLTSGSNYFIYVEKSNTQFIPDVGTLFEILTPKPSSASQFYEFSECYEISNPHQANRFHKAGSNGQNQDPLDPVNTPATGTFKTGNVYYRFRNFVLGGAKFIEDSNVSDFYSSFTTQTGRPQVLDKNAKQVHRPTAIRISNPYFSGTTLNGFSSFEALNVEEIDRVYGAIEVLRAMSQSVLLAVCQHRTQPFYIGSAVIKTTTGTNLISVADDILNKADTLIGQRGTQHPQSVDTYNNYLWAWDESKGVWWRYSSNGLEDISRYKAKSKFIEMAKRTITNVVSVFDPQHNNLVTVFEDAVNGDAFGFNDGVDGGKNRWITRYSFNPETVGRINNQLLSWKNGQLWVHDSAVRNNFYGVQYVSQIEVVTNENPSKMKSWQALSEETGFIWTPVEIETNVGSTPQMKSRLKKTDFVKKENFLYTDFKGNLLDIRFTTQLEALVEGEKLRGEVLTMLLENDSTLYADLFAINVYYIDSERSNQ